MSGPLSSMRNAQEPLQIQITPNSTFLSYTELRAHLTSHQQAHTVLRASTFQTSDETHLSEEESHQAFRSFRESIQQLQEAELLSVLTTMQNCIDMCKLSSQAAALRLQLLQDICLQSEALPHMYWITGVTKKKSPISSGREAIVYRAKYLGGSVVVREFQTSDRWGDDERKYRLKLILREIIIHWQLRHPNVVALIGIYRSTDNSCSEEDDSDAAEIPDPVQLPNMVLQDAKYLSAQEYLKSDAGGGRFPYVTKGIVDGVVYLHSRNPPVIHGDLHDRNILITVSGDPLICDFDLSHIRHALCSPDVLFHRYGYPRFVAPELSSGVKEFSNEASDIYSLAMVIYSLGVGKKPLWNIERDTQAQKLLEGGARPGPGPEPKSQFSSNMETFRGLDDTSSVKLWLLLRQMWVNEPTERIIAGAVCEELACIRWDQLSPPMTNPLYPALSSPYNPPEQQHIMPPSINSNRLAGDSTDTPDLPPHLTMSDAGTSNSRARRMGKVKSLDGCWTCRISKKRCPLGLDEYGRCSRCVKLDIECLRGYGERRPAMMHNSGTRHLKSKGFGNPERATPKSAASDSSTHGNLPQSQMDGRQSRPHPAASPSFMNFNARSPNFLRSEIEPDKDSPLPPLSYTPALSFRSLFSAASPPVWMSEESSYPPLPSKPQLNVEGVPSVSTDAPVWF